MPRRAVGPWLLVLTGMPASGKSTVAARLKSSLDSEVVLHVSVDDILRLQCPPGAPEFAGRTLYTRQGSEFLLDDEWRPTQLRLALQGLLTLGRKLMSELSSCQNSGWLILELPTTDLQAFQELLSQNELPAGLLLILQADVAARRARNHLRGDLARLPSHVFDYFESTVEQIDIQQTIARLRNRGWQVEELSSQAALESLFERVDADILSYVDLKVHKG